ncbi:MAG TPA: T9SS type A sorting domain-containing protein [Ignavibacteriaceae bacterium]|nr:T9SS type A sorting domain-containing protein [Ignavibacteriaceae bacterium]
MNKFFNLVLFFLVPASLLNGTNIDDDESKTPDYKMSLSHGRMINRNTFEFDVYINSLGKKFVLESYQCAFNFGNNLPANGIQFDYISNSSELKNAPMLAAALTNEEGKVMLAFASQPSGTDTVLENEVKIGRFKVMIMNPGSDSLPSISWNFKGNINTIISASSKNITNPSNHLNFNGNPSNGDTDSQLPKVYAISQNFPNPFNPTTAIRFSLPFDSKIKISIFNALGELVTNLADKIEQAGNHHISWDASGMASGMYIYTIEAEPLKDGSTFRSVKKMMLLK